MNPARGLAALVVVMGLFLLLALVAAYANRNIIIEQRISAGSVRAERATQAADSAVDWVAAMLNTGRIDDHCQPTADAAMSSFRNRYLLRNTETNGYDYVNRTNSASRFYAGCRMGVDAMHCICPSSHGQGLAPDGGDVNSAAFRVTYDVPVSSNPPETRPATITVQVRGCANAGTMNDGCLADTSSPVTDAIVDVRAHLGLVKALPALPVATLTVGNLLSAGSATAINLANTDPQAGVGVQAGVTPLWPSNTAPTILGPAGSAADNSSRILAPSSAVATQSSAPSGSGCENGNCFFRRFFAMDQSLYKRQPAVVRVDCSTGCTLGDLESNGWTGENAGRPVFVTGNLTIDSSPTGTLGSSAVPILLVVSGTLNVSASVDLVGLIYAHDISWSATGGSMRGAIVAAQNLTLSGTLTAAYDAEVLKRMRDTYGSFVRIPAAWNRGGTE
jgi:hypothetical protein